MTIHASAPMRQRRHRAGESAPLEEHDNDFAKQVRLSYGRAGHAALLAVTLAAGLSAPARAADYPNRAVHLIVPTGAGGGYDVFGRIVADQLSQRLGQAVVVENRTGAGTIVGTKSVIAAQPDGYTLLVGGLSNIIFNARIYEEAPYDALKQLVPVAIIYKNSYIVVGSEQLPYKNIGELIAAAKAKPNSINLATAGVGTGQQLSAVAFMMATGTKFLEVPYKGATAVYPDLLAGRVDIFFDSTTGALPFVKAGKVKGLAILSNERSADTPEVPTMQEAGVKGLDIDAWIGIFAPAGTPKPVVEALQKAIAASTPVLSEKFLTVGGSIMHVPVDKLDGYVKSEFDRWSEIIKTAGIKLK
jgi:tripartite-type tricarboxylate transporter receptor subunit TctC